MLALASRIFRASHPDQPRELPWMRLVAVLTLGFVIVTAAVSDPGAGVTGRGLGVSLGLLVFTGSVVVAARGGRRPAVAAALAVLVASSCALMALGAQPPAFGGVYLAAVVAALRLPGRASLAFLAATLVAISATLVLATDHPADAIISIAVGVIPFYLLVRLVRVTRERQLQSQELVDELRRTREAEARSAALAERGRVARDMHDVLAHTLSGLALQLEGARLLAADRDADPEVRGAIERAHRLAAEGLQEARRAIGALRGDDLPGPEALAALAEETRRQTGVPCELRVNGTPRKLEPDARLAVYRAAQEAITNVQRHAAAERVDLTLAYEEAGTSLVVQDHGRGNGGSPSRDGGGYGLTGMRERAELLGGRLSAEPTADGFRVELWLPS
jgi:signal transduction histidine kinase